MKQFPQKTIARAFLYLRALDLLIEKEKEYVSSKELAEMAGVVDVQVRKDVSSFGKVGKPRVGYQTNKLKKLLEEYIVQHVVHVVLFGVGNLGSAILQYPGFRDDKVKILAAFDSDPKKIGKTINGITIHSLEKAKEIISKKHIEIGVIACPKQFSQKIADLLVTCRVKGIINFSPTAITVPKDVYVRNIDLAVEFLGLYCDMQSQRRNNHA